MRRFFGFGLLAVMPFAAIAVLGAQYAPPTPPGQPAWAYGITVPPPAGTAMPPPAADSKDAKLHTLAGTDRTFTIAQIAESVRSG